jgi:NADP-dependent 3-hydroxy acid dehydrogenase YdfG
MTAPETRQLNGKVAIITGASSGIGEATARLLAGEGMAVVLAARRDGRLDTLQTELEAAGGRALAIPTDVTDRDAVDLMVQTARDWFERIDVLVNSAGVMLLAPVQELLVDEWDRMVNVNIRGVLNCTAAVLPTMIERGGGHVVNVGSVAGRRAFRGGTVYSATKFAVRALSAGFRSELSPDLGIRVTDVQPGVVDTELPSHSSDEGLRAEFDRRWEGRRSLDPEDIARAVHYAVSQPPHVNVNEILVRPTDQVT